MTDKDAQWFPAGSSFWPRRSSEPLEIQEDLYCESCGYNLRGLKTRICPECGKKFDPKAIYGSRLPWGKRRFIGAFEAYVQTVWIIMARPQKFTAELMALARLSHRDANRFRWLTVAQAYVSLLMTWFMAASMAMGASNDLIIFSAIYAVMILVWLNKATELPVNAAKRQHLPSYKLDRVVALSHYTCAPLVLAPVYPLGFALSAVAGALFGNNNPVFHWAIGLSVIAGLLPLLWWARTCVVLLRDSMNLDGGTLIFLVLVLFGVWALQILVYLVGIPVGVVFLADEVFQII